MFPADSLYLLMFGSGLLGGFGHCIGMCGPIVATYSLSLEHRSVAPHLLYNLGRITTYSILGGLIGLTGSFAGIVRSIERFQSITLALTGAAMVVMALSVGGWLPLSRNKEQGAKSEEQAARSKKGAGPAIRFLNRAIAFIAGTRSTSAHFPMGVALGFLPCGLLYTALMGAAAAGMETKNHMEGLLSGMLLMLLFGLGTAPPMLLLGRMVSLKSEWLRNRFYKGSAFMMIAMGVIFVYRAFR